jgi:hypothetical protein
VVYTLMPTIPTKDWDKRNVWPLPSNELAVRKALEAIYTDPYPSHIYLAGFTVKNPRTDMVYHYAILDTGSIFKLVIVDEDWVEIQSITLPINRDAGYLQSMSHIGLTYGLCEDEILVCSPLFSSYWGNIGGSLILAELVASINSNFTAQPVPRGICIGWAGRNVIASPDGTMWFSDASAPRTYVPQNAVNPPGGSIYGLHVNAGGALILCTANGVYALPEDAAATGQIVVGIFSKLSDYQCLQYDTTCVSRGRVYGLTEKGFSFIDTQNADEIELDEKFGNRSDNGRLHFDNYRVGRIYGGAQGPIVTIGGSCVFIHATTGFKSWWTGDELFSLVGVLFNDDGEEVYLSQLGPGYTSNVSVDMFTAAAPTAYLFGRYELGPEHNPVIRHVYYKTNGSNSRSIKINGVTKSDTVTAVSPIIGTDTWGSPNVYREQELLVTRTDWAVRTTNVNAEITLQGTGALVPTYVDIKLSGPGKKRVI